MYKPSRRAAVIAASFALGLSTMAPAAHAGLLDGGSSNSPTVEGVGLPVVGGLLDGVLGGGLLGDGGLPVVGNLLGGDLLGDGLLSALPLDDVLGGGGLPVVGDLLGGDGGLPVVGDVLGGGLPVVGDVLGGGSGLLSGAAVVGVVPNLGFVPGLGSVNEILQAFSDSGSLVPGLQVLDETGILGVLGSL